MAKHNDKEFQDRIKAQERIKMTLRENLEKQFRNGITQGMYAACKVISDKASDETKTYEERINDIITFCKPALKDRDAKPAAQKKAGD